MNSLVSIIIPNFNCEKYISNSIKSVLNQTYTNWELIIIDDASTDASVKIVKEFQSKNKNIKLIELERNSGSAVSRNEGIKVAKGDYIAFLDSDDMWLPNKLEVQLKFMNETNCSFSFTSYFAKNENSNQKKLVSAKKIVKYTDLLKSNYIGCLTAVYNVNKIGKFYFPEIRKRQDWALWLKLTKQGVVGYGIDIPLAIYTIREHSISSNKLQLLKYNWQVYRKIEKISFFKSVYYLIVLVFIKYKN